MKCGDVKCQSFNQEVPADHRQVYLCGDVACKLSNQYVPWNHKHVYRDQAGSKPKKPGPKKGA